MKFNREEGLSAALGEIGWGKAEVPGPKSLAEMKDEQQSSMIIHHR